MKLKKINKLLLLIVSVVLFGACEDHFKIDPLTEIDEAKQFSSKTGYYSALYGVYLEMAGYDMYGAKMRYYLFDDLAQTFADSKWSSRFEGSNGMYDYETNEPIKAELDLLWNKHYNLIANLNNLLENLEDGSATKEMFPDGNYEILIAESKALRAFFHFNLVKIFAPSIASDEAADAIPYMNKFDINTIAPSTVREVYNKIIKDLEDAEALLAVHEPLLQAETEDEKDEMLATYNVSSEERLRELGFRSNRLARFNYYAVQALLAKVYLYAGNNEKAYEYAEEVLNNAHQQLNFGISFLYQDGTIFGVSVDEDGQYDKVKSDFTTERKIFPDNLEALYEVDLLSTSEAVSISYWDSEEVKALKQPVVDWLNQNTTAVQYYYMEGSSSYNTGTFVLREKGTYLPVEPSPGDNDIRWMNFKYSYFFNQYSVLVNSNWVSPIHKKGLNYFDLLNHHEIKLIAAETASSTADQLQHLNELRGMYSLAPLETTDIDTEEKLEIEIEKEYKKNFYGKGELFFYFKRKNKDTFKGINQFPVENAIDDNIYVLPYPLGEGF
ncbi:RagB/SusD family nutrient uptake outer membrane protein [Marinifilum sp.]|uniref:RagB/SusD family nutrient uptake outer membrane protein n=1 Tax=Marinifilum sp. TaxID=2033137 RepID=UPI003BAC6144